MKQLWTSGRVFLPALILAGGLAALGFRLYFLQVLQHDKWRESAEQNTQRLFLHEPRRGDILDANGNPLATSIPVKRLFANPRFIGPHHAEVARELAPLIQWPEPELAQRLRPFVCGTNKYGVPITNAYVNLRRKVSLDTWEQVVQTMSQLTGNLMAEAGPRKLTATERSFYRGLRHSAVYALNDYQRVYYSKQLAGHVLGFAQDRETEFNDKTVFETIGRDGIEAWFNSKLAGARGWRLTETDNRRREILIHREQDVEPKPGLSVVLTLDMVVQNFVETHLAEAIKQHTPASASSIVMRPRTGELLAMATLPNYDPNRPGDALEEHGLNRLIAEVFEPGSTFKLVVIAAALNEGLAKPTDLIDCEHGRFYYLGRWLRDHGQHGQLTVEQVLGKSSNIGAAKLALRLGEERLNRYITAFGFGAPTGIPLGGEVRGIVHPPKSWDKLMITRVPMGQAIAVTHLQLVMAMGAVANQGRLMRPLLVKELRDQHGEVVTRFAPQMVRQAVSETAARQTVKALKIVATPEGTAPKAALAHYTVAGKTGTAQIPGPGGYLDGQYVASFIGFFPADDPEVCISVVLVKPQNGYFGSTVAVPIFKRMSEQIAQYLKIRPDREAGDDTKLARQTVPDSQRAVSPDRQ